MSDLRSALSGHLLVRQRARSEGAAAPGGCRISRGGSWTLRARASPTPTCSWPVKNQTAL